MSEGEYSRMAERIVAAILAGGKSRRMGFDKALAKIAGETLLFRTARIASEAGLDVLVVGRERPVDWPDDKTVFLPDRSPGCGPMGGIATALEVAEQPVLALACDMPLLTREAVAWLLDEASAQPPDRGIVAVTLSGCEPLFSIYTPACLAPMRERLESGDLSLQSLIAAGGFQFVQMPEWVAREVANMNTPQDMALLGAQQTTRGPQRPASKACSIQTVPVRRVGAANAPSEDFVAVEEPLEIRLGFEENGKRVHKSISITMRTPGDDCDLAAGFLFTEGIVRKREEIARVAPCGLSIGDPPTCNTVRVDLAAGAAIEIGKLTRHFYTSSSCGVCGKASLEALRSQTAYTPSPGLPVVDPAVIHRLPAALRAAQEVFEQTGGLHACALFTAGGELIDLCEDVGRHNALDKLIGRALLAGNIPLSDRILLLSGRASFELIQKAVMAGIPVIAAVGAPSSLAVALAKDSGATLLGFVRDDRFNIYAGAERVAGA